MLNLSELELSTQARMFQKKKLPENTLRSSKNGSRLLAHFVLALVNDAKNHEQYSELGAIATSAHCADLPGDDEVERSFIAILLLHRSANEGIDDSGWKRLRHFLIEFCTRYISSKTKKEVMP